MSRSFLLILLTLLIACGGSNSSTNEPTGKTRREQLKEVPYRGEIITDRISGEINQTVQEVFDLTTNFNEVAIFYLTSDQQLEKLDGTWVNGREALDHANEIWKEIDLKMTVVLYPSYSQNAQTGETSDLWVMQFDHKEVSRTCRVFFDTPNPTELPVIDC